MAYVLLLRLLVLLHSMDSMLLGAAFQSVCESCCMTVVVFCRNLGQEPICLCHHVLPLLLFWGYCREVGILRQLLPGCVAASGEYSWTQSCVRVVAYVLLLRLVVLLRNMEQHPRVFARAIA